MTGAALFALAILSGGSPALAAVVQGPQFGVYTANIGIAGAGHLEASLHVLDPPTKIALTFDCGKPTGRDTVTEVLNTAPVPLHGGAFSFRGTSLLSRLTTVTENNAIVNQVSYKTTVNVNGAFTSHRQFVGTVQLGGSPCNRTSYTASRLAGPTP
jgi:hypothetical protein